MISRSTSFERESFGGRLKRTLAFLASHPAASTLVNLRASTSRLLPTQPFSQRCFLTRAVAGKGYAASAAKTSRDIRTPLRCGARPRVLKSVREQRDVFAPLAQRRDSMVTTANSKIQIFVVSCRLRSRRQSLFGRATMRESILPRRALA